MEQEQIKAVTMWADRVTTDFVSALDRVGAKVFAHTVNEIDQINQLMSMGVFGIYTDFVTYDDLPYAAKERYKISNYEFSVMQMLNQIDSGNESNYTYILQTNKLSESQRKHLSDIGVENLESNTPESNYLIIKRGSEILFAESSSTKLSYSWTAGGKSFYAHTDYNDPVNPLSLLVDDQEYAFQQAGSCLTIYDHVEQNLVDVQFAVKDGSIQNHLNEEYILNRNSFTSYLSDLSAVKENYIIVLSAQDEASNSITDSMQQMLYDLGLTNPLQGQYRYSYLGIVDGGQALFEECALEALNAELLLDNCVLSAASAGYEVGNHSSIKINGKEYSTMLRGLNIVLYHKLTGQVVDSVSFDTCSGYIKTALGNS